MFYRVIAHKIRKKFNGIPKQANQGRAKEAKRLRVELTFVGDGDVVREQIESCCFLRKLPTDDSSSDESFSAEMPEAEGSLFVDTENLRKFVTKIHSKDCDRPGTQITKEGRGV